MVVEIRSLCFVKGREFEVTFLGEVTKTMSSSGVNPIIKMDDLQSEPLYIIGHF